MKPIDDMTKEERKEECKKWKNISRMYTCILLVFFFFFFEINIPRIIIFFILLIFWVSAYGNYQALKEPDDYGPTPWWYGAL